MSIIEGKDREALIARVHKAIGTAQIKWISTDSQCIGISLDSGSWSYAALKALSAEFYTEHIDIWYEPGCGDYSEYTPGDPASCEIRVSNWSWYDGRSE